MNGFGQLIGRHVVSRDLVAYLQVCIDLLHTTYHFLARLAFGHYGCGNGRKGREDRRGIKKERERAHAKGKRENRVQQ